MLELQRLHVAHADDIEVTFSQCEENATVRTRSEADATTYELTNYLRAHGCCSCVEGTQDCFCVHHLLALCAKFNKLTRNVVCDHANIAAGSSFGNVEGCQLGQEGLVPLVTVLREATTRIHGGESIKPDCAPEAMIGALERNCDQALHCCQVSSVDDEENGPMHDSSTSSDTGNAVQLSGASMSPTKTLAMVYQVADAVASARIPMKQTLYAAVEHACGELLRSVSTSQLNNTLVQAGQLSAVRAVNVAQPQEKRKSSGFGQLLATHRNTRAKEVDAPVLVQERLLQKTAFQCLQEERRQPENLNDIAERKAKQQANRIERE